MPQGWVGKLTPWSNVSLLTKFTMQSSSKHPEKPNFDVWFLIYHLLQYNTALEQALEQETNAYYDDYCNEVCHNHQLEQELREAYRTIDVLEHQLHACA